jgi:hypothetical protein
LATLLGLLELIAVPLRVAPRFAKGVCQSPSQATRHNVALQLQVHAAFRALSNIDICGCFHRGSDDSFRELRTIRLRLDSIDSARVDVDEGENRLGRVSATIPAPNATNRK